jgi:hypothetical protein
MGQDFLHLSRLTLGPAQPPIQWVPGHSGGVKRPGRCVNHLPPSSAEVKERIELYLYSASVPSWQVIGWTLLLQVVGLSGSLISQIRLNATQLYHKQRCSEELWRKGRIFIVSSTKWIRKNICSILNGSVVVQWKLFCFFTKRINMVLQLISIVIYDTYHILCCVYRNLHLIMWNIW